MTDDEIAAYAETVKASKPAGKRITLGYLAPGLLEDPKPIARQPNKPGNAGGSFKSGNDSRLSRRPEGGMSRCSIWITPICSHAL